ncbi:MAG: glycosyltransferase family 4 protein [Arenicella sp.]
MNQKKLLLITDAWSPQTNGVVTTLKTVLTELEKRGYQTDVIHPGLFNTIPLPFYPEIKLAIMPARKMRRLIEAFKPDHVHIATEGTLGAAAKRIFDNRGWRYTTSLHTKFPEYVNARLPFIKVEWGYSVLKRFHQKASSVLVTTSSLRDELMANGLDKENLVIWGRGVDSDHYRPDPEKLNNADKELPLLTYVGRLAIEKNLQAFLDVDVPGRKRLVGDGPQRAELERKYPEVEFAGYKYGEDLVSEYQQADVFVFPSRTDTFGLVMLEAMACGTPVAAFPVPGPVDVVQQSKTGVLDEDLASAIKGALQLNRQDCREYAEKQSWQAVTQRLLDEIVPFR